MAENFQKHKNCHKIHTSGYKVDQIVPRQIHQWKIKFTPGLNSAIGSIEEGVFLERRYVTFYYVLQTHGYDQNDKSCWRFFKSKLTETYDNLLLFETVEQSRPIIIISLSSIGSQLVSNFVENFIILKQFAAISKKKNAYTFVKRHQECPDHQPLISLAEILVDHLKLFQPFIDIYIH